MKGKGEPVELSTTGRGMKGNQEGKDRNQEASRQKEREGMRGTGNQEGIKQGESVKNNQPEIVIQKEG